MDKRIRELYNEGVLKEAAERYGVKAEEVQSIGGFESFVYQFSKSGKDCILRLSHSIHRSINMIKGEIEWINHLFDCGVPVSRVIKSTRGEDVERIDVGDTYFIAVVFEKAKGRHVSKEDFGDELYTKWGRGIGKIHKATKSYKPSSSDIQRLSWEEEFLSSTGHIPKSHTKVIEKSKEIYDYLKQLPVNNAGYGLVHTDAHQGNFFVDNDKNITFFDFDDGCYKWFASDIAIPLFYMLDHTSDGNVKEINERNKKFAINFMNRFLEGYHKENNIDSYWIKEISKFLKLRELMLYSVIHRSMDMDNLQGWVANFMNNRKERIEKGIPIVDIDFGEII